MNIIIILLEIGNMSFLNVEKVCRICVLEKEDMQGMFDMVNCNGVELPISKVLSVFIQEVASNEVSLSFTKTPTIVLYQHQFEF